MEARVACAILFACWDGTCLNVSRHPARFICANPEAKALILDPFVINSMFSCKHATFCRIKGFDGVAVDLHLIVALAIMRYSEVLLHSTIADCCVPVPVLVGVARVNSGLLMGLLVSTICSFHAWE